MSPRNRRPFFFSISHIIKPAKNKLVYGVRYNDLEYFLSKTQGVNDCEQMDENPSLEPTVLDEMCKVITEIEKEYKKPPPLEFINIDVFNKLASPGKPQQDDDKKKVPKK